MRGDATQEREFQPKWSRFPYGMLLGQKELPCKSAWARTRSVASPIASTTIRIALLSDSAPFPVTSPWWTTRALGKNALRGLGLYRRTQCSYEMELTEAEAEALLTYATSHE
jgi:hypothetical protein